MILKTQSVNRPRLCRSICGEAALLRAVTFEDLAAVPTRPGRCGEIGGRAAEILWQDREKHSFSSNRRAQPERHLRIKISNIISPLKSTRLESLSSAYVEWR